MQRALLLFTLCGLTTWAIGGQKPDPLNAIGEKYAHLVLALGQHDPDYVDAFYGPAEWKAEAEKQGHSLDAIAAGSKELGAKLEQELRVTHPASAPIMSPPSSLPHSGMAERTAAPL